MEGWRMEGWSGGGMEWWRDGVVAGWSGGGMEWWRDGVVAGWRPAASLEDACRASSRHFVNKKSQNHERF